FREHLALSQAQQALSQAQDRRRAYEAGTLRSLCLLNTRTALEDHLQQGMEVCEKTLELYGVLEREDWQRHPDWQRLALEERRQPAEGPRERLVLLAGARVRKAPQDEAALHEALAFLDRASAIEDLSPSPAVWQDRASYLDLLGDKAAAREAQTMAER